MRVRQITMHLGYSAIAALVLISPGQSSALAVDDQHADHIAASNNATGLLKVVRE